ncbi:hypothetical protein EAE96_010642 [Botrytis aclada]|nr:hypothetical protein EAE96_010642 [Botrytis aclada]
MPDVVIKSDRFPNQTAVSNYYTGNTVWTTGSITGSATARLTSYTATETSKFSPTTTGAPFSTGGSGSASGSGSAQATISSSGAGGKMKSPGGVLGAGALLMQCMAVAFIASFASC